MFTRRKLQVADAWEDLRKSTLRAAVESMCLPDGAQCCNCHEIPAEVRCVQCGPTVFLCQQCTISLHKTIRLSHTPEIWKGNLVYFFFSVNVPSHRCTDVINIIPIFTIVLIIVEQLFLCF